MKKMSRIYLVRVLFFCVISLTATKAKATNYTNTGGSQSYSLGNKDSLKIVSGTFTGTISSFNTGAVIIVSSSASFKPAAIVGASGTIMNYGTTQIGFSLGVSNNFTFENYGIAKFLSDLSFWAGAQKTIINHYGAQLTITGNLTMDTNSDVDNQGAVVITGSVSFYAGTAIWTNSGTISIGGSLSMSNGQLINTNTLSMSGNMNIWGGLFSNSGSVQPGGTYTVSSGTTQVNNCKLVTQQGFTNYGTFQNNGVLWVGRTNTTADEFTNSGTFTNGVNGKVKAVELTNYGSIAGSGYLYFTGSTLNSGIVGIGGTTTDSIRVYDATRTNPSQIFDTQWGTVHANAVFKNFAIPDTNQLPAGCSASFRAAQLAPLPVKWNYFYAKLVDKQPLLEWGADYEANMQFQIERSYNNADFAIIHTGVSANAANYTYNDETADMSQAAIYYRIKGLSTDGSIKYTEVKVVKPAQKTNVSVSLYPNPAIDLATVSYTTESNEQVTIQLKSASGQQLLLKNFVASAGINHFDLPEVKNLQRGLYFVNLITKSSIVSTERLVKE
jgi:Secretion system C-terminal sorting domain